MSSLANQLKNIASLDAARLTSRSGAPVSKSYLFAPKIAATHDLDAIFSLAQSGFEELLDLDPSMAEFEDELFSEKARRTDRMMLTKKENEDLDETLGRCLRRLGKWIGIMAGGKCIEWLVRRFRIHEMNAETVLQVFLPYHQSPNFPRMLSILTIPQTSVYYAPFHSLIKNAQPLPRSFITTVVSPARDKSLRLLTDIAGMVQRALDENVVHRALLTFWSATMVELIEKEQAGTTKSGSEGLVKVLVEAFVGILSTPKAGQDVNAAVYPPLILLTRTIRLADGPFLALLSALLTPQSGADPAQRVLTLLLLLQGREDWTQGLGKEASANLGQIDDLGNLLVSAMEKYGFDHAVRVVVEALLKKPKGSLNSLTTICSYPGLAPETVEVMTSRLLQAGTSGSETTKDACKVLLALLMERHPTVVDKARIAHSAVGKELDDSLIDETSKPMAFLNAYSADSAARIQSISTLMQTFANQRTALDEVRALSPIHGTDHVAMLAQHRRHKAVRDAVFAQLADADAALERLRTLLCDSDPAVVSALYHRPSEEEQAGLGLLCTFANYVAAVKPAFTSSQPDRKLRKLHLEFLSTTMLDPQLSPEVFQELLFPHLLSSPGGSTFSGSEVDALLSGGFKQFGLLAARNVRTALKATKTSMSYNKDIAIALADAIVISDDLSVCESFLVQQLSNPSAPSRLLAHLILTHMVQTLRGDHQVELAVSIITRLDETLRGADLRAYEMTLESFHPDLLQAIHDRPHHAATGRLATLGLFVAMLKVVKPFGLQVTWLSDDASVGLASHSVPFKDFTHSIYQYANSNTLPASLANRLLRSLLTQLGEDALTFFASVWTGGVTSAIRISAIRHALAFVRAYTAGTDFQLVVPALLIALQDSEKDVREAGKGLLKAIIKSTSNTGSTFYALDTFYGSRSKLVQLLKPTDLNKYLQRLDAVIDQIVLDPSRLAAVQTSLLGMGHGQGRKESSHRRAVIGSLISHVCAWRALRERSVLLGLLAGVHDGSIVKHILPLFRDLDDQDSEEAEWLSDRPVTEREAYLSLVTGSLSPYSAGALVEADSDVWKTVLRMLSPKHGPFGSQLRELLLQRMASGVFDGLPIEQRVTYFCAAVRSIHDLDESTSSTSTREALKSFSLDATALILVIDELSRALFETATQGKRQKQEGGEQGTKLEQTVDDLTVLLESRDWKVIAGDAPLVASLMSILSGLLAKRQSIKEGIDYLEQELLGAILVLVEKIQDPTEIQKAHVGVEVVVKVIRASTNPRTSQRALLVASELARLIPDAVLHNVMPIFTFMGASDFQRDDAYSFGVVEKTVARIVPVMSKSLKEKATTKLELYSESLTFISIFTDMAGRLPRHRTLPFFVHLVQSLNPADYLAPVTMLLVERTTTKAGRSTGQSLDLPLGLSSSFDISTRLDVILEVVEEINRLVPDITRPEKQAFLSHLLGDEADPDRTLRQIGALLHYVIAVTEQLAGRTCKQSTVEAIAQQLIVLGATTRRNSMRSLGLGETVEKAIVGTMQLLSADGFLGIIVKLLNEGSDSVELTLQDIKMALELFVNRLPVIKPAVRTKAGPTMAQIVQQSSKLLLKPALVGHALEALKVIASTALAPEDPALSQAVPKIVEVVGSRSGSVVIAALSLLELTTRHLASRIIPHINVLINSYLKALSSSPQIAKQVFSALAAKIETVPTFVSTKQLTASLKAAVEYRVNDGGKEASNPVLSVSAKKVPTKSFVPVVMELWKQVQSLSPEAMQGFFHLLRLTLRHADRQSLPSLIKPVFAFFLDVFDLRHRLQAQGVDAEIVNTIEESAIGSFLELVTKLNEATFKPLFTRLYDWAVIDLADGKSIDDPRLVERKIVLLHVMMGLLQKFRHLLSPYIGTLLPHIEELLPAYAEGSIKDQPLWTLLLQVLAKSFEVDDGAFWTDALHQKLIPHLISQLPLFPPSYTSSSSSLDAQSPLTDAIASLAGSTTSTPTLKALNTSLLLATRADEPATRIAALKALEGVWTKQPEEMVQFVPETVAEFLSELLEDDNSDVEAVARRLLVRIEGLGGSVKEYLE